MLQLSALSYERQTIAREIARNKAFVSRHGEVDLADATEAVAAGASNEHQAMLARLTYELQQRKKLKTSNEELGRKKASLAQSVSKKRKYTDTLPGTVAGLVDAARPLLAAFDSGDSASPEGKSDLPPAVYVLVSQLQAHRESFQPEMDITIKGSAVDLKVTKSDGSVLTLAFQHLRAHNVITVDGSLKPKSGKPMVRTRPTPPIGRLVRDTRAHCAMTSAWFCSLFCGGSLGRRCCLRCTRWTTVSATRTQVRPAARRPPVEGGACVLHLRGGRSNEGCAKVGP